MSQALMTLLRQVNEEFVRVLTVQKQPDNDPHVDDLLVGQMVAYQKVIGMIQRQMDRV